MTDIRIIPQYKVDTSAYINLLDISGAPLYAYPWYIDALSINWYLLVVGNYKAAMPLYIKVKVGLKYLPMPFFIQQWGIFTCGVLTDGEINSIAKALKQQFHLIEYHLCLNNPSRQLSNHFNSSERVNYLLDLSSPYDQLIKNYNEQTRRNLKTALKTEDAIALDISPVELINIFKQHTAEKVTRIKNNDYDRLEQFMNEMIAAKKGEIIGVKDFKGHILSGAFFITASNRMINLFPTSRPEGRQSQSMTRLLNWVIEQNSGKPITLDFEGSMVDSVARFYKGFGATAHNYLKITFNKLPWWVHWLRKNV